VGERERQPQDIGRADGGPAGIGPAVGGPANLGPTDGGPADGGPAIGRRAFFGLVGLGLTSLVWGGTALRKVSDAASTLDVLPGAIPIGDGWRIYSVNPPYPRFAPATWRLRIDGLVAHPQELTYRELLALPRAEQVSDFHCVTGWSVPNVRWSGVRFHDLLAAARPLPSAKAIAFISAEEPYIDMLTLEQLGAPDAMLAHAMDGKPLSRDHGAPARLVMPKMYGYKGVKWVKRIVLTDRVTDGYWEERGYDRDAWVGHSNGA
jgi:DMSO/TMAO reductase YedYZ molybdopterin-dependent catalytic subunit